MRLYLLGGDSLIHWWNPPFASVATDSDQLPGKELQPKMRTHKFRFSLLLSLLLSSGLVLAQSDVLTAAGANRNRTQAKQQANSEWYNANQVSLTVQAEGITSTATYEITSDQDLKITTNTKGKNGQQGTSEIMFVNGQSHWMQAKNVPLERGYEIDALDGPVLTLKLVTELLRAAAPAAPVTSRRAQQLTS